MLGDKGKDGLGGSWFRTMIKIRVITTLIVTDKSGAIFYEVENEDEEKS